MVKVSVVMPIYNVEEFLEESLGSIINQTLKDIEIICINDGSTDNSLNILKEFASNDERITVIDQKNGGHAVATNRGIDLAKGEYLYLMDSDDKVSLTTLEETYNYAKKTYVDFVIFQSMNYVHDEDRHFKSEDYSMNEVADFIGDTVVNYKDLGDLIFKITVTPWSKLYNNRFIQEKNIRFPEGLVFDDNIFFWDVLFNAKRISFYRKYLFTRRWYSYSSTTNGDLRFLDSIQINNLMIDRFKKYGLFEKYKSTLYNRKVNLCFDKYCFIKKEYQEQYYEALYDDFQKIISEGDYDDYINHLDERNKKIFLSCVESNSYKEFNFEMGYYDKSNTVKRIQKENKQLSDKIKMLNEQINRLIDENNDLKTANEKLVLDDEILKDENKALLKEITLMKSSNSWKITKPLRSLRQK